MVASVSSSGRFVAFSSAARNLVAGDTNGADDVFLRDRQLGLIARASASSSGAQGNGSTFEPSISADGAVVAFGSDASNLVSGDTNARTDVFAWTLDPIAITSLHCESGDSEIACDVVYAKPWGTVGIRWSVNNTRDATLDNQESIVRPCTVGNWYSVRVTVSDQYPHSASRTQSSILCRAEYQ